MYRQTDRLTMVVYLGVVKSEGAVDGKHLEGLFVSLREESIQFVYHLDDSDCPNNRTTTHQLLSLAAHLSGSLKCLNSCWIFSHSIPLFCQSHTVVLSYVIILFHSVFLHSLYSVLFYCVMFYCVMLHSILLCNILIYSILFSYVLFYCVMFYIRSIQFYSIVFYSILSMLSIMSTCTQKWANYLLATNAEWHTKNCLRLVTCE